MEPIATWCSMLVVADSANDLYAVDDDIQGLDWCDLRRAQLSQVCVGYYTRECDNAVASIVALKDQEPANLHTQ